MKKVVIRVCLLIALSALVVFPAVTVYAQNVVVKILLTQGPVRQINNYFSTQIITYSNGTILERAIINGPPAPPPGYEFERTTAALPEPNPEAGVNTLPVPAYMWVFGCSAVSGSMIAAYYDRNGFPNMYTGPTGGGVMPLTEDSSWGTWTDSEPNTFPNNPLIASHNGLDGRAAKGSIDDYWIRYGSGASDPYAAGSWTQHAWGDAIGDYMKTSQSAYDNTDGSTTFYTWTNSPAQLTCADMVTYDLQNVDGTFGRKLFYEARGYTVTDCYNRKTDNTIGGGFSFDQFKAEIDAGRPVMLNLEGHTIVGVGYDDSSNTVYIHDTWDNSDHTMAWGGSYSGMALRSVSVVNIQSSSTSHSLTLTKSGNGSGTITSSPSGIDCGSTCSASYNEETVVTLTASAAMGSAFDGWSGGGCSGTGTCTVTMNSNTSVDALFTAQTYLVTPQAGANGSISPNTPQTVNHGSTTSFTIIPNSEYKIDTVTGCGGTLVGTTYTTGSITGACTVMASFIPACTYTISPISKTFPAKGFGLSTNVTVTGTGVTSCPVPQIRTDYSWITPSMGTWTRNKATVKITVTPTTQSSVRTGTVAIGDKTFTATQTGAACSVTALNPTTRTFTGIGGEQTFTVTTSPNDCPWSASTTQSSWIHITSGSGVGNGTVSFSVDTYTGTMTRSGSIVVQPLSGTFSSKKTFTVKQTK